MKTILGIVLVGLFVAGCATQAEPPTQKELASGQVKVLTSRRDGVSIYR